MIEDVLVRKKNDSRYVKEKNIIHVLGIFGLVLFSNLTRIISLEATTVFIVYENTRTNLIVVILVETILVLNHCRRVNKGSMRCYE
jgi:hypothetical protein